MPYGIFYFVKDPHNFYYGSAIRQSDKVFGADISASDARKPTSGVFLLKTALQLRTHVLTAEKQFSDHTDVDVNRGRLAGVSMRAL
jgi:hypothetical protein